MISSFSGKKRNCVPLIVIFITGEPDAASLQAVFGIADGSVVQRWGSRPHSLATYLRDTDKILHLDPPLQYLLHQAFVWTLFDLFAQSSTSISGVRSKSRLRSVRCFRKVSE